REYCRMEVQPVDAAQAECVRRHLHGGVRSAFTLQLGEKAHQVERLGSSVDRLHDTSRQVVFDCSQQSGSVASRAQDGIEKLGCGCLPIGARDTRESEPFVWLAVEITRGDGEGLTPVRNAYPSGG